MIQPAVRHTGKLDGRRAFCYRGITMSTSGEESIDNAKSRLRLAMKALLPAENAPLRREAARLVAARLSGSELWADRGSLYSFLSLPSEIDTAPLNETAAAAGKVLGVPRIHGTEIVFHRMSADLGSTSVNRLGIREPPETLETLSPGAGEGLLVIVPGLAFTAAGRRLGRGGGYYDRFLASVPEAITVGLCFELQLVDELPVVERDVSVQWLLTERRLFPASAR